MWPRPQADLEALCSADAITRLRAQAEAAAAEVLATTFGGTVPAPTLQQVRRSTQRLLHAPTVDLRSGQVPVPPPCADLWQSGSRAGRPRAVAPERNDGAARRQYQRKTRFRWWRFSSSLHM